jgi:hypothetical protein
VAQYHFRTVSPEIPGLTVILLFRYERLFTNNKPADNKKAATTPERLYNALLQPGDSESA